MTSKVVGRAIPNPERCPKLWCRRQAKEVEIEREYDDEMALVYERQWATCPKGHTWDVLSVRFE